MQPNDGVTTLNHLFFHHLDNYRFGRLLSYVNRGRMEVWSTERFSRAVFALRRYLLEAGLKPGDRVAVFSENRPEWHIADFAIQLAQMVLVPIYNTLSPAQIAYQLQHSGTRLVIVAGERQWGILDELLPELPEVETVIGMEEMPGPHTSLPRIMAEAPVFDGPAVESIRAEALTVDPDKLATIVYTSGTTGTPKGVMLSHRNITFDLQGSLKRVLSQTAKQALSVLPLPHVLERVLTYGYFYKGIPIAYGDPHELKVLLPAHHPEIMGVVPRILEKVQEAVEAEMALLTGPRRAIAHGLLKAALTRTRERLLGDAAPFSAKLLAPLANLLVFPKVRRKLGGLRYLISGGAWLNPDIELFFRAAGFDVLQGYGMTETSPVITLNEYTHEKVGSVGTALEGVEMRLSEDNEVLTRGLHVMLGYYKDPEATRQVLTADGWMHTGDLGRIDPQGNLTITGRRKEILVLSNGKNVSCAALEHALQRSPYIQQVLIVGHGCKFVSAMIIPHLPNVTETAAHHGLKFSSHQEMLLSELVVTLFRKELDTFQTELSNFERAKRFCFMHEEALLDTELVTPTQKVRRSVLERKYAGWIQQMYQQEDPLIIPPPAQAQEMHAAR